jgi:predicted nucleotidyltransferase component of viral defense system
MIDRSEILATAERMSLLPNVVEKDYVLGWMLAGIYAHPALQDSWVFKGGTCLKKCFFETYRFSEDLDFTLTDERHLNADFLQDIFAEIGEWIHDATGIDIPADGKSFDVYKNPRGSISCEGKISYCGPISSRKGGLPRIKLDLMADERLVLKPVTAAVFHPYSDAPEGGFTAQAYAYEEVFAEKVRALAERTRPRDLYDVINLFRNEDARPTPSVMLDVLRQKCEHKGIGLPTLNLLEPHRETLAGSWHNMLNHQLPSLPPWEAFWDGLPEFFDWLSSRRAPVIPAAYVGRAGETTLRERVLRLPISPARQAHVEVIRFAAANRLCVELDYRAEDGQRSTRTVEPYSLRRTQDENIILHTHDVGKDAHRSLRLDRIEGARVTNRSFTPRYQVELTAVGPVQVSATAERAAAAPRMGVDVVPRSATQRRTPFSGPTYVYQCPMCQKAFNRKAMDNKLNPHKNEWGGACLGRTGYYVTTRY